MNTYKSVIGIEIHVELKTKSKMFCQCDANYFGKEPNTNTCPVCLGLPGALPVPNKKAIEWCILIGKALNCTIPSVSKFDRKHYFYPDLPKGYQISQYDEPIAVKGCVKIKGKKIRITRVHQEEDTGKLIHSGGDTLVDFNRSGVPLVEIVTEPDFDNAEDVKEFLEELHTIIRYLEVSDADMEKGSMRMEPNISLQKVGEKELPNYKVEVKNINSFRFVKQAIEYELERQKELLEKGETPPQETRGFDEKKVVTYSQRSKEEAQDYRYFPEPDIPPLEFTKEYVDSIRVPELPVQKFNRFVSDLKIKEQDAFILTRDKTTAEYFELASKKTKGSIQPQAIANLIINKKVSLNVSIDELVKKVQELRAPKETDINLLEAAITQVIEANKKVAEDYKRGKQNALMFLVGQVMKELKGKADAKLVIEELKKKLS
ncbi:Asp-tRNA(Asn)/Glu-tRNA(Gln) amidotransferase subunit GatB [Candidatus Roizmanbacteria bacterium]|nr:Asp-tRNA(Asn)/Glu-tRNA(Gln) amidotransferase subunit GatB [Candidatus Roizmanbacteria bacterium]